MKVRKTLQSLGAVVVMTIVTLAALEVILRIVDLRELREGVSERSLSYQYDSELGWMPKNSFETGLALTVRWYLANRAWWEPLLQAEDATRRRGLAKGAKKSV